MTDKQEAKRIMKMTEAQLLAYVMVSPEYLTDSYYAAMGNAIRARYKELAS
jgi:hypothetical protein